MIASRPSVKRHDMQKLYGKLLGECSISFANNGLSKADILTAINSLKREVETWE